MKYRLTLVVEYDSIAAVPPISFATRAKDMGDGQVVAFQRGDALVESAILEESATPETRQRAYEACIASERRPIWHREVVANAR